MIRPLLLALLVAAAASAQDPDSEAAADAVLKAVAQSDAAALVALARRGQPDPWLVADALCARGEFDAAVRFARAAPRPDTEKLPAYVEGRRGKDDSAMREGLARSKQVEGKSAEEMWAELNLIATEQSCVVGVRLLHGRGLAGRGVNRWQESTKDLLAAAEMARKLGWHSKAAGVLHAAVENAYRNGQWDRAIEWTELRLEIERHRGDTQAEIACYSNLGGLQQMLFRNDDARANMTRALELLASLPDDDPWKARMEPSIQTNLGRVMGNLGELSEARAVLDRARAAHHASGDALAEVKTLTSIAEVEQKRGDCNAAKEAATEALEIARAARDEAHEMFALLALGEAAMQAGESKEALGHLRELMRRGARIQDPGILARARAGLARVHRSRGEYNQALSFASQACADWERMNLFWGIADATLIIAKVHSEQGKYDEALREYSRAADFFARIGDRGGHANAVSDAGVVLWHLNRLGEALEHHRRALAIQREIGSRSGESQALTNLALVHSKRGEFHEALRLNEQVLELERGCGSRAGEVRALSNLGLNHLALGRTAQGLTLIRDALDIAEEIENRPLQAFVAQMLADAYYWAGDYDAALEQLRKSLELVRKMEDRTGEAQALRSVGQCLIQQGDYEAAATNLNRSLRLCEELGLIEPRISALVYLTGLHTDQGNNAAALDSALASQRLMEEVDVPGLRGWVLLNLADTKRLVGQVAEAVADCDRALELAEATGNVPLKVFALDSKAWILLAQDNAREAVEAARRGIQALPAMVQGLDEARGATARSRHTELFEVGAQAALKLDDPTELAYFLESGRAGALLESLGVRSALRATLVPEELLRLQADARDAVRAARVRAQSGEPEALAALRRAENDQADVIARIQSSQKAGRDLTYPEPLPLDRMQALVDEGEALVLYGIFDESAMALVVTGKEARAVDLGSPANILAACARLQGGQVAEARGLGLEAVAHVLHAENSDPQPALDELRRRVVAPLGLKGVKRVFVSPSGPLTRIPLGLAAPELEVIFVPSVTVYERLRARSAEAGKGVLAVGDPDYAKRVAMGRAPLKRLPATRAEAQSVGDVVLLDKEATETNLARQLAARPRWRSVHLACHGVVYQDRPLFSELAITPDAETDGSLTVLEIFQMRIPADLVVLSACDTGRGRLIGGEGMLGLNRAFMLAGASRVLVSLWPVDDKATQALMVRFYELWQERKLSIAAALRGAQEHVRSTKGWEHPCYWGAWVLWGLE